MSSFPAHTRPGRRYTARSDATTALGPRLRAIRLRHGVGLRELARRLDLSPSAVSRIETGKNQPSILFNFFRGESNMAVLRAGIRLARKIMAQKPFTPHLDAEIDPGPDVESDGAIDAFIRERVGTLFHPVGTCAMGSGPEAVVEAADWRAAFLVAAAGASLGAVVALAGRRALAAA